MKNIIQSLRCNSVVFQNFGENTASHPPGVFRDINIIKDDT